MKKLLYSSIVALAGLLAASCIQNEPLVQYNPAEAVAPTLAEVSGVTLTAESEPFKIEYGKVDYGFSCATSYQMFVDVASDFSAPEKLSAKYADGSINIEVKTLNSMLLNLGAAPEEEFTLYFRLSAYMANDKAAALASTELQSNIISATFVPYNMLVSDKDTYAYVYVIGTYCDWKHDNPKLEYLYDYNKDGNTFTGVIDFGDKAAEGFKLTGDAGWETSTGNWGSEAQAEEAEAASVQLINDGNSKDIKCYSKRYYNFSFDKTKLTLSVVNSFDQMGIVGSFNGWGDGGTDVVMSYNPTYSRFYADVELAEDAELKFRLDGAWTTNWGNNGNNISVAAGNYRVYFSLNKMEYSFDAKMYGQEEPGIPGEEPAPVKPTVWNLAGSFNGWSPTDETTDLSNLSGDVWVIRNLSLNAGDEFKIVANHDTSWSENYGGHSANSTSTISADNPYEVFKPELGNKFELGGSNLNIQVPETGVFDITFDYAALTMVIEEHVAAYSLIGMINGDSWTNDILMTADGNVWTSPAVSIEGGFKIRYDYSWADENCYGAPSADFVPEIGVAFTAVQPGADIKVAEPGNYKVSFNSETKEITLTAVEFPETLYMIGEEFGNWNWSSPEIVDLVPVYDNNAPAQFWTVRYISAGKGFKFCSVKDWKGDFNTLDTNEGFTAESGNCFVDTDGFYMIHIDLKNSILHVEPARIYGIGSCFGGWDEGMENALFAADGKTLKATLAADGEIRMYAASSRATSDWWTREFIFFDGQIAYRGKGGDQERVNGGAGQTIVLDFNAGTATLQ